MFQEEGLLQDGVVITYRTLDKRCSNILDKVKVFIKRYYYNVQYLHLGELIPQVYLQVKGQLHLFIS